ncbi:MAG: hypothetical protein J0L64_21490 [Acidobacteria bacterium]|nr:hypothetical protein [Acidobacteriota bacterium]
MTSVRALARTAVAAVLLGTAAVGLFEVRDHLPQLVDQVGEPWAMRRPAEFVIVGVALDDGRVSSPMIRFDPRATLQLRRVTVAVENVLQGGPLGERIEVFYFTWAGAFNGPRPLWFGPGVRRVWWLRRDAGVLRTICDGWDTCTQVVESGAHRGYRPVKGRPVILAVADVLLTRGEGEIHEGAWAREMMAAPDQGIESYVVGKMRHLALTEKGAVRQSACLWLWIYAQDPGVNAGVKEDAGRALREADCRCEKQPDRNMACL